MKHLQTGFLDEKGQYWVGIIPTVHRMLAHVWELISMNNGNSLARWSEFPVESWNKHVRSFQSGVASKARQTSLKEPLWYILLHANIFPSCFATKQPRLSCSICGDVEHTARAAKHKKLDDQSRSLYEDENMIQSNFTLELWFIYILKYRIYALLNLTFISAYQCM